MHAPSPSQKHNPNAPALILVGLVLSVDSPIDGLCAPVVQVMMQLAVASAEFELFEEERVVVEREGVEDVEFGLDSGKI